MKVAVLWDLLTWTHLRTRFSDRNGHQMDMIELWNSLKENFTTVAIFFAWYQSFLFNSVFPILRTRTCKSFRRLPFKMILQRGSNFRKALFLTQVCFLFALVKFNRIWKLVRWVLFRFLSHCALSHSQGVETTVGLHTFSYRTALLLLWVHKHG